VIRTVQNCTDSTDPRAQLQNGLHRQPESQNDNRACSASDRRIVIFLILILMSNKQRFFDKRLVRMQSEVNDLRATESRRFLMDLNVGKAHLVQPGAEVVSPATVEGPEVIPLIPASRR
jgi:hypothetical protein